LKDKVKLNKIIDLFYEMDHDKIAQVIFVFDLMTVATRESCDVMANLVAMNSQWHLKFGDVRKKGNIRKKQRSWI
jgi:hypothetical protein